MKRLLESRLATAAADARQHIEQGAVIDAVGLPSIISGVERAAGYASVHHFDQKRLDEIASSDERTLGPGVRDVAKPAENLLFIKAWLKRRFPRSR